ncbi:homing endonuclease associated repeat-containing protein [Clostridium botulinum]|uniref:homing endonuclease associated repeat-containing protein n=1 Tax=Clostridium botulinum TaxID=1491 RepID=UPI001E480920|nr:hypothetical protein [Clostridium botulinum]
MKNPLTNEQILQIIRDKAKELGRVPKRREVGMWNTIYNRFGSWNNALIEAGLTPKVIYGLSKEEILGIIKKWAKEHNKTPSISDWTQAKKNGEYLLEVRAIQRKFNLKWNEILQLAGLEVNAIRKFYDIYTDKELLDMLKKELKRIGTVEQIKFDKLRGENIPSTTFYRIHFNKTWIELLQEIGYTYKDIKFIKFSREELMKILKDLYKELEHTPSIAELNKFGFSERQFKNLFGSWNNAITSVGLEKNIEKIYVKETNEELLQMYINFSKKIGKSASVKDLNSNKEIYNADVFTIRFGGMTELKELAGFKTINGNKKYTKEKIKELLLQKFKEKGRRLYNSEINKDKDLPCTKTVCQYFHTTKTSIVWEQILKNN